MAHQEITCKGLRDEIEQCADSLKRANGLAHPGISPQGSGLSLQKHKAISEHLIRTVNEKPYTDEPWKDEGLYFKKVLLSKQASYKILQHAVNGKDAEIMGMLVGTVQTRNVVVYDSYALPVEGTETRVNAQLESYEYMVQYMNEVYDSRPEKFHIVGWYHSHPGYGCWLSGIDVQTQELNQTYQDPYVAVVVDPKKTLEEKRLSIGAFRTIPTADSSSGFEAPAGVAARDREKYGHHFSRYYELELEICGTGADESLQRLELRQDKPIQDCPESEGPLEHLLECIKNWHNYQKLSASSQFILNAPPSQPMIAEDDKDVEMRGGSSFVSVSSTGNSSVSSAVDDNERSDVDMTSLHLKRQLSTQSSLLVRPTDDEVVPVSDQVSQETALASEIRMQRKKLHLLKLQEYQRLRYYRDAFTL
ncbi:COP9 signalosome catalytic subunit RRI1 LALA0_S12e03532g [Lachancea lanzarotensis]|uniref:COP9 signalosome complex subunit 5 n=1 Tax=Lachancea lanzarotensis TaxID=1245769 RepID=A0A0C7N9U8_9SACH|nr:uncharacterized protein LALA0_S12e03532g [Lachancea lanzarotensis]CEP64640.1 LALA0S12e03532g1_1 [Lachancea lanzarotensis]